ncbi:hypothetical protein BH23ACT10_BH23ACT10_20470 [soil metagenome]
MAVRHCPKCELRFRSGSEYHDHLRMEHGVDPRSLDPIRYGGSAEQEPIYPDLVEKDTSSDGPRKVLVVSNAALRASDLQQTLISAAGSESTVYRLVVPAVESSPLTGEHSAYDTVGEIAHPEEHKLSGDTLAEHRRDEAVARLRAEGLEIDGVVGNADPLRAIESALESFKASEVILATLPRARSGWLDADLPTQVERRYGVAVTVLEAT